MHVQQVLHLAALVAFGLHHHALHAALVREVVDVAGAHCHVEYRADIGKRHAQGIGLAAVDLQLHLRAFRQRGFAHVDQYLALAGLLEQLVTRRHQRAVAHATPVLQAELEAGRLAKPVDGRRQHGVGHRILELREGLVGALGNRLGSVFGTSLGPVLEGGEGQRSVLPAAREAETQDQCGVADPRFFTVVRLDLGGHLFGAHTAGARRQLDVRNGVALVFGGQERRGQLAQAIAQYPQQQRIQQQVAPAALQRLHDPALVAIAHALETAVEPAEETLACMLFALGHRLEQRGAQCRGQAEGEECREQDRYRHGDRKLLVDHTHRPLHEGHGQEHRHQYQGDADDRAADLAHGLARGLPGRQAFFGHDAFDVLHHHDGVIDQDADGQHHAEQGQHVDREA